MLTTALVFMIVLFLYIYIMNQFKISEDLDIYEMDYLTNTQLQEICDVRQPVLFQCRDIYPQLFDCLSPTMLSKYGSHNIHIKDNDDYFATSGATAGIVPLSLNSAKQLMSGSTATPRFFSEQNDDFLEETGIMSKMQCVDEFLKPIVNMHTQYDLLLGSPGLETPLQYHTHYRRFLCVTSGKIRVKMTPWKNSKYLHPIKDYENYEFRSPVHPSRPSPQYASDFEKIEFLEFDVLCGHTLFIPPYWWYSIQYSDVPDTIACSVSYTTLMNIVSNLPNYALYWLQLQNITKKFTRSSASVSIKSDILDAFKNEPVQEQSFTKIEDLDNMETKQELPNVDMVNVDASVGPDISNENNHLVLNLGH